MFSLHWFARSFHHHPPSCDIASMFTFLPNFVPCCLQDGPWECRWSISTCHFCSEWLSMLGSTGWSTSLWTTSAWASFQTVSVVGFYGVMFVVVGGVLWYGKKNFIYFKMTGMHCEEKRDAFLLCILMLFTLGEISNGSTIGSYKKKFSLHFIDLCISDCSFISMVAKINICICFTRVWLSFPHQPWNGALKDKTIRTWYKLAMLMTRQHFRTIPSCPITQQLLF